MKNENDLLSIFGAKVSKDGKKLVLVMVSGENENKRYYNACIKLDNSQKTHAKVVDNRAVIEVDMLKDKTTENDELPF
jgi:hypothetical protein